MVTINDALAKTRIKEFVLVAGDFDLTAVNQTAQDVLWTLPADHVITDVIAVASATTTSSATLTALNLTVGLTSTGTEYLTAANLDTAAAVGRGESTETPDASDSSVYMSFVPVGTGGNWSTLTVPGTFTVSIHYKAVSGEAF